MNLLKRTVDLNYQLVYQRRTLVGVRLRKEKKFLTAEQFKEKENEAREQIMRICVATGYNFEWLWLHFQSLREGEMRLDGGTVVRVDELCSPEHGNVAES